MQPLENIDPTVQETPEETTSPPLEQKKGRKKQRHGDRIYTPSKPVTRVERTYSDRKRQAVLMYLAFHRIHDPSSRYSGVGGYRNPFGREASKIFNIPKSTIQKWWQCRDKEKFERNVPSITCATTDPPPAQSQSVSS
ncbi:hypothetical protein E4U30_006405 [Claviceps sp. LM220 group G6]|nr:hypothetical protein E4U15_006380 [Claviceps sp. LM218 group G6]KAG6091697.1 hypothetical protein E4U30_006405 [Claviceps sp. LM220 group G6]KAG6094534.1 hypothetical protein E4U31_006241 [Claviceps sp. LM219 group G6]KAG6101295.1 hypothetical protein E4U14_006894 [Claviceps sp. LM454 group G7]